MLFCVTWADTSPNSIRRKWPKVSSMGPPPLPRAEPAWLQRLHESVLHTRGLQGAADGTLRSAQAMTTNGWECTAFIWVTEGPPSRVLSLFFSKWASSPSYQRGTSIGRRKVSGVAQVSSGKRDQARLCPPEVLQHTSLSPNINDGYTVGIITI